MARKRTNDAEVTVTPQPESLDLTGLESAEDLNPALQRLYAEMGQDEFGKIKVYIYRIDAETGKEPRVWEGAPGDYDLMNVARRFGSADYRVKVHGPHESGRIVIFGNTVFPILLDPSEDQRIALMREGKLGQPATIAPQALTPEGIASIVAQTMKAALPQQADTFAQMERLAGVISKLMPTAQPVQQGGGFMETLKAATSLMELSRSMNPPTDADGRTDVKGMALAKGIDFVSKMFEKSMEQAKPGTAPVDGQPQGGALLAPDAQQAQGAQIELSEEQREELEMLRIQIKMVNRQAKANVDTEKLAEDFYDDLPDAIFDLIVFEPNWFAILTQNVADCAQHKEWYEKMRASIIAKGIKDGDLKAMPDGSLIYVNDESTTQPNGTVNAGNVAATSG